MGRGRKAKRAVVRVEVTARDICRGVVGSTDSCPVALAIKRRFKLRGPFAVRVFHGVIYVHDGDGGSVKYTAPWDVNDFVHTYDKEGAASVAPISFTMRRSSH